MTLEATRTTPRFGIREISEETGISIDTLRWYEREGLIPNVIRSSTGRRVYGEATLRFVRLVQSLRRTGMPVADIRRFVQLGPGHSEQTDSRLSILDNQMASIKAQQAQLRNDKAVIQEKIDHYQALLAAGLDCEDEILDS